MTMNLDEDLKRKGMTTNILTKLNNLEVNVRKILSSGVLSKPAYPTRYENTPPQLTADQNNYDPGDYGALRMSSDASRTITGISGGVTGRVLVILNVGSNNIVLSHQSASSSAANRIITATAASITLSANDSLTLYYDSTDARWRVKSLAQ